jgi:hypothetical protein
MVFNSCGRREGLSPLVGLPVISVVVLGVPVGRRGRDGRRESVFIGRREGVSSIALVGAVGLIVLITLPGRRDFVGRREGLRPLVSTATVGAGCHC